MYTRYIVQFKHKTLRFNFRTHAAKDMWLEKPNKSGLSLNPECRKPRKPIVKALTSHDILLNLV